MFGYDTELTREGYPFQVQIDPSWTLLSMAECRVRVKCLVLVAGEVVKLELERTFLSLGFGQQLEATEAYQAAQRWLGELKAHYRDGALVFHTKPEDLAQRYQEARVGGEDVTRQNRRLFDQPEW